MATRYELSEVQWERIKDTLPGRVEHVGRTAVDKRVFVNGVFWVQSASQHYSGSNKESLITIFAARSTTELVS